MAETSEYDETGTSKVMMLESEDGGQIKVIDIGGIIFPMPFFDSEEAVLKRLSLVKNLQYKSGDVMICSYPKTGTHWTANLIYFLQHPDGPLEDKVSHGGWLIDLYGIKDSEKDENRRLLTSHLHPKRLPRDHFANGGKTILVFRNPKDSAVSMYYMMRKQKVVGDFNISWDKFLSYWLEGKILFGSYFDYYNKWQAELKTNSKMDVLIVQYENLKKNSLHEVRRIQNYLGTNHSDERLQEVINRCSIDYLRNDVESGKVETSLKDDKGKSVLYRKGIIGDWKNHFTVAQNEEFEKITNEKMKDSIFNYKAWN
ncbi:sulfotransferase 2A1-like [Ruditapes philippinarum]|uniref:sulfotransferase 2A1-like n=1 Tax=Ruditapes philippinarum TaxID=129788 RepID=UPI00295AD7C9|nr:sulfotransferase 2A1-like [Ruditapes philippinarum]